MRERYYSKKDQNGQYDPQVGAAAAGNTAIAERAQAWNEDYFTKYVSPVLNQMVEESKSNAANQKDIHDLTMSQAKIADERYRTLGIPAQDAYIKKLDEYSAPDEEERQARAALGDQRVAQQNQQDQLARKFRGLGIDPTSPAALSAQTDVAAANAAADAGAQTRARDAARVLGMTTAGEKANVLSGAFTNALQASGAASAASSAGLAGTTNAAGTAPGGAGNVNTGLGIAQRSYGANLDAYTTANNAAKAASAQASAGIGSALGLAASAIPWSDRRLKKHAKRIATLAHDIGLWAFHYLWDDDYAPLRYGYMADEVEPVFPDAVRSGLGGYKMVDYSAVLV
jgi:hypothetical protein